MQVYQELRNDFHCALKSNLSACKILSVWTKIEENSEIFQENFEIFWSKPLWKLTSFTFLRNISWIRDSPPKAYTCGREEQVSTRISPISGGGGSFRRSPSRRYWFCSWNHCIQMPYPFSGFNCKHFACFFINEIWNILSLKFFPRRRSRNTINIYQKPLKRSIYRRLLVVCVVNFSKCWIQNLFLGSIVIQ